MDTPRAKEVERRISADPWDIDGWNMLAIEAQRASFDVAKPVYERLVSQFPPAGKFWRMYAEHSAREDTRDATEVIEIYDRAVSDAPTSIDLWISFVTYVTNQVIQSSTPSLEAQVLAIYERALATVGLDVKAEPLWSLYINFVANHATLSDAQRQDELRRIYQRAVMLCTLSYFLYPFCSAGLPLVAVGLYVHTARLIPCLCFLVKKRTCICLLASRTSRNVQLTSSNYLFLVPLICSCDPELHLPIHTTSLWLNITPWFLRNDYSLLILWSNFIFFLSCRPRCPLASGGPYARATETLHFLSHESHVLTPFLFLLSANFVCALLFFNFRFLLYLINRFVIPWTN